MSLKKNIELLKQGWKDIRAFFAFKRDMMNEESKDSMESVWHIEELKHNKFWNVIYKTVDIPQEYENGATDQMKFNYIMDQCRNVNEWFDFILLWGEYLIYRVFHYSNEEDPSEKVLTYQVEWHFVPIALTQKKFWAIFILFLIFNGAFIFSVIKWLVPFIISLI